jgi:hypothetical protein
MRLSTEQLAAVKKGQSVHVNEEGTDLVVLRADLFERLRHALYDDSGWTDEEMDLLAAENADALGWEGMEGYQDK